MKLSPDFEFRAARREDAEAAFDVTKRAIAGLARGSCSPRQIDGWMGERTPSFYEELIAKGRTTVCLRDGAVVGFVDAEPGELTRLFILPEVAGIGLGRRLLEIGIDRARPAHGGSIKVEATINAEAFYRKHGFVSRARGHFSYGLGGEPIEIVHMELQLPATSLGEGGRRPSTPKQG